MDESRPKPAPWLIAALNKRAEREAAEEAEQEEAPECGT